MDISNLNLKNLIKDLERLRSLESNLWGFLQENKKDNIRTTLSKLHALILKIIEVQNLIKNDKKILGDNLLIKKDLVEDFANLDKLLILQINQVKEIEKLSSSQIVEILNGDKKDGNFSESSQIINRLISRIEKFLS